MKFAVIGAGVVGLTTALELQNQFSKANVTIIAENFGRNTTSFVAAGIFRPGTTFSGPNETITRYLYRSSTHFLIETKFLIDNG